MAGSGRSKERIKPQTIKGFKQHRHKWKSFTPSHIIPNFWTHIWLLMTWNTAYEWYGQLLWSFNSVFMPFGAWQPLVFIEEISHIIPLAWYSNRQINSPFPFTHSFNSSRISLRSLTLDDVTFTANLFSVSETCPYKHTNKSHQRAADLNKNTTSWPYNIYWSFF